MLKKKAEGKLSCKPPLESTSLQICRKIFQHFYKLNNQEYKLNYCTIGPYWTELATVLKDDFLYKQYDQLYQS